MGRGCYKKQQIRKGKGKRLAIAVFEWTMEKGFTEKDLKEVQKQAVRDLCVFMLRGEKMWKSLRG